MKAQIEIIGVKEVKGFIHENSFYNYMSESNRLLSHTYEPKALFIEGIINGEKIKFYSPSVIVTITKGFLNFKSINKNSWFELIEGKMNSYRGAEMFDNSDKMPNVAIECKCEIKPKINVGDILNISYSILNGKMKRVKILS